MREHLLLSLQILQVGILLLHDWIPIPHLNDLKAMRRQYTLQALALGTLMSSLFPLIGLVLSATYWRPGWSNGLYIYLVAAYGFLFLGELEAWWVPCLLWAQPERAARYQATYGNTAAFLPARNGIQINTLHVILHSATMITLLLLGRHFISR